MTDHSHARPGFSILETLVAVVLMGILLSSFVRSMGQTTRTGFDTQHRFAAATLAQSAIETLRGAGPSAVPLEPVVTHLSARGEAVESGMYEMTVVGTVECTGGPAAGDARTPPSPVEGCPTSRPVVSASVSVSYPSRREGRDSVSYTLLLGTSMSSAGSLAPLEVQ